MHFLHKLKQKKKVTGDGQRSVGVGVVNTNRVDGGGGKKMTAECHFFNLLSRVSPASLPRRSLLTMVCSHAHAYPGPMPKKVMSDHWRGECLHGHARWSAPLLCASPAALAWIQGPWTHITTFLRRLQQVSFKPLTTKYNHP